MTLCEYLLAYLYVSENIFGKSEIVLDLRNTTLGYGFNFQYRKSRTFPIESFAHDSGRTFIRAEYGYPKGSSNTKS
jgi:hypothetical protein